MKKLFKLTTAVIATATIIGTVGTTPAFAATNKTINIEGQKITVPSSGNKWVNVKGYWHFVKNGTLVKGWKNLNKSDGEKTPHWSYFDKNGRLYTGWHKMGSAEGEKTPHWSYFGGNGWLRTGWQYLAKADGEKTPHFSYFGPNGWLRTGWQSMGTKTNPDGNQPRHMSYFGANGWLRTGWVKLGKGTSEPDGNSAVHFSYFGANGWLRTGWQSMGKGTVNSYSENSPRHMSFFGGNGWLRTGLVTFKKGTANSDGNNPMHQSYFGENGWLITDKSFTYRGDSYKSDGRGWLTQTGGHTHNWQAQYKTVHHDEVSHMEEKTTPYLETIWSYGVQFYDTCTFEVIEEFKGFDSEEEAHEYGLKVWDEICIKHMQNGGCTQGIRTTGDSKEVTKYKTEKVKVIDKKAYDEEVYQGLKCTICGKTTK